MRAKQGGTTPVPRLVGDELGETCAPIAWLVLFVAAVRAEAGVDLDLEFFLLLLRASVARGGASALA